MTDREILELLLKNSEQVNHRLGFIDNRLESIDNRLISVEADVKDLKITVHQIQDQNCDLEAKNATNYLELKSKIDKLANDLIVVEAVSGKNMTDIAFLKAVK